MLEWKGITNMDKKPIVHSICHSWSGRTAHIARSDGSLVRCEIGDMIVKSSFVGMVVKYREGGHQKKKNVCPIFLASLDFLWWSRQIVSEGEMDNPPIVEPLPLLSVPQEQEKRLTNDQILHLHWIMEQCQALQKLL